VPVYGVVNQTHQANGFGERRDNPLVVLEVVKGQFAALAVFEPFLADLIAADVKRPDFLGDALEILRLVNPDAPLVGPSTIKECAGEEILRASRGPPDPAPAGPRGSNGL
jgi:hypothetical protein